MKMIYNTNNVIIDDNINIQEYEYIISNNKGIKHKYTNKDSKRFLSFYINAKKRNIQFNITYNDYLDLLCYNCQYCNDPLADSIDRINSYEEYTINNIQLLCRKCNMMKHTMNHNNFLNHIKKIYQYINK